MQRTYSHANNSIGAVQQAVAQREPSCDKKRGRIKEPIGLVVAYQLFWFTFILFFASTAIGKLWDRVWHLTHRFDTFWSLPHFFIFIMTGLTSILVIAMAFLPKLRPWFGPALPISWIPFSIPGSLAILGSGLIGLSCALVLDTFWHSHFGLDETQWSFPHDLLAWCWLIIIIGFVAARLAFRPYRPITWITKLVIGMLIIQFLCSPIFGPLYLNYTPSLLQALAHMPIVRTEPTAQHTYHIYLLFGITRQTSLLFIPLAGLFAGISIAFLQCLDRRIRIFILIPLLWSLAQMTRDLYTILFVHYDGAKQWMQIIPIALREPSLWVPIPLAICALVFTLLYKTSFTENRIYLICGIIFGLCTYTIWHIASWEAWLAISAGLTTLYGSWIGKWLYHLIEKPTGAGLMRLLFISYIVVPGPLGIVDLCLRWATPW